MASGVLRVFELKQIVHVQKGVAAGMDKGFCIQVSQVSQLRESTLHEVAVDALLQYVQGTGPLTASTLQQMEVPVPVPIPPAQVAPIMPTQEAQRQADLVAAERTATAQAAARASPPVRCRVLSMLATDERFLPGLDAMVTEVIALMPAGDNRFGVETVNAQNGTKRAVTEDESKAFIRGLLQSCTGQGSHRVAGWLSDFNNAETRLQQARAVADKAAADKDKTWTPEDVEKARQAFNASPQAGGYQIAPHFLCRARDCKALAPVVRQRQLPVTSDKLPAKFRPYKDPGASEVRTYEDKKTQSVDSEGTVIFCETEEVSSGVTTKNACYAETRRWAYTVLMLSLGVQTAAQEPWCTVQAMQAWLEMLSVVEGLPDMTPTSFVSFRDANISGLAERVNTQKKSLTDAFKEDVANFELTLTNMRLQRSLSGLDTASRSAASTPNKQSDGAEKGGDGACSVCGQKKGEVARLTRNLAQANQNLQTQKNLVRNKEFLVKKYREIHGDLPASVFGQSGAKQDGKAAQSSAAPGGKKRKRG